MSATATDDPAAIGPLGYHPALDGLRAVAIAIVVGFHVDRGGGWALLWGGFLGVDVFFVLSGFLITSLLIDERAGTGGIRLGAFWGRRAARLFPLLWAVLAVFAFARWVHPIDGLWPPTTLGFAALLLYVGNWLPVVGRGDDLGGLEHLWSLSVEEQFYLVWPLVVTAVLAGARSRRTDRSRPADAGAWALAALAGGLAVAVMVLRATVLADTEYFFNTLLRCDGLLLGAALAATRRWWQPRLRRAPAAMLAAVGATAMTVAVWGAVVGSQQVDWRLPLVEVGTVLLIAGLVAAPMMAMGRIGASRPLVWLGRCAYAIYLLHVPIFDLVRVHVGADRPRLRMAIEIPLVLLVAAAVHRWYEMPAQRKVRRWLHAEHRSAEHAPDAPQLELDPPQPRV